MSIEELKALNDKLSNLLTNPQPGLWAWREELYNTITKIRFGDSVPLVYGNTVLYITYENGMAKLEDKHARMISNKFNLRN